MTNNKLGDIIKSEINISNPVVSEASFNKVLLVVPVPKTKPKPNQEMKVTTAISSQNDLLAYGFVAEDIAYKAAAVAFSQKPRPSEILVCVRKNTASSGSAVYENLNETLKRASGEKDFYGFHITSFKDAADVKAAVTWAEENGKLYGFEYAEIGSCPVTNFNFYRSFGIFSGLADGFTAEEQPEENAYAALALMAKCFGYKAGTETWHLKELSMVVPTVLSQEQKNALEEKNINRFLRYANTNCTIGGKVLAGEWIDVIRFRDWLEANIQTKCFNALKANPKLPFKDAGIGLIEGAINSALSESQDIGGIAPTEFDKDGNEVPGYVISVPRALDFSEADRKSRKLNHLTYTARLAGAIHLVEVEGSLTF